MSSNTTLDYNYYLKLDEWEEKEVISLLYCGSHHLAGWLESARKSGKIKPREEANVRFKMMKEIAPPWTSGITAERYYDETGTGYYYDPFTVLDWAVKKEITLPNKALQDWYDLQNQARNNPPITDPTKDVIETELNGHEKSSKLRALNRASVHFWNNNVDRDDKTTWPNTEDIVSWLVKNEYSETLADRAATIIRPDWAGPGRKSKE